MKSNSTRQSGFHLGYQPALDGFRGFAVLWVIGFHYQLPFGQNGLFGVDIFFALSGFLITVLLVEEWEHFGNIQLGKFYLRRILRLYPALIVILILYYSVAPRPYILSTLFYYTNWIKALHIQPDSLYMDHVWSLSIEEQYYLLWPLILLTMMRIRVPKKIIVIIPLMLGIASSLGRIIVWNSTHEWFRVYMGTDLHADGLLLGSAFGLLTVFGFLPDFKKFKHIFLLISLITSLLTIWLVIDKQLTQSFVPNYGILGVSLGTIILINNFLNNPSGSISKLFRFKPLVKVGTISYGLYLWHPPIGVFIDQLFFTYNPFLITVLKILLTFTAAILSYLLVEKPVLKLKNKFVILKVH